MRFVVEEVVPPFANSHSINLHSSITAPEVCGNPNQAEHYHACLGTWLIIEEAFYKIGRACVRATERERTLGQAHGTFPDCGGIALKSGVLKTVRAVLPTVFYTPSSSSSQLKNGISYDEIAEC
jgi:hypothetical protein